MTDILPFLIIGLTTGSIYGLAAMGLVLTYKTSGIFNFAHGAIAALAAYAFYDLHAMRGLPWPLALLLAAGVLPALLAVLLERMARRLADATVTMKIVATVGLQLAITGALLAHYGAAGLPFPDFLPVATVTVVGLHLGLDQLISAGIAAAAAVAFFLFFRLSRLGVRMRAVVGDPDLLELAGTSAVAIRSWSWLIGSWFAAVSGILLAPQIGLDALLLTLLVVQAYGAAAIGLFSSLPLTYAGGLVIGVLTALATSLVAGSEALAGLPPALPFLVLFLVLLVAGRRLVEVGSHRPAPPSAPLLRPRASRVLAVAALAVAATVPLFAGARLPVYANALVFLLIFASLHLLVRVSGQVSLAHAGLVAVGAAAFSHLAVGTGLPWLLAVLLAGAVAVPVGAAVAVPAIRLSGLFLALGTFGFGLLLERVMYRSEFMFGTTGTLPAPRPEALSSDTAFYYVLLAFAACGMVLIALITRSRLGRLLRAMADSPTTLSTLGLGINVTRVTVFCLSAFIAGVAGALYASTGQSATGAPFTAYASLTWLAVLVLFSPARSAAPVLAALLVTVVPAYGAGDAAVDWMPVVFGLGAMLVALHQSAADRAAPGNAATGNTGRARERIGAASAAQERLHRTANRAAVAAAPTGDRLRITAGDGEGTER
ncbi:ABC transporter permease [Haloechinothrix sp. LS1_15]|uniref:branched-chain amino acid ABC transporter permease n=1 Tax=Haloechinothrix sp. LS1_15 TaxID=2652248 RepID=UPI00294810D1|nr:ABC transporter permease [Haloechinothrix sp. LS1_15]MDV6014599.1 ABC transporter permease [Haloechinothrix sp. LS1_15]